jgi:signal transduction histidine kinase
MSRYDPIRDPSGQVVGMLYIGELEAQLLSDKHQFAIVGVLSIASVLLLAFLVLMVMVRAEQRAEAQRKKVRFEFLRVLGHELKAPINAVEGYLRIMDQETLGPVSEEYATVVRRSILRTEQMRKLIADMLDLTRIEAGEKHREILDELDVAALLRESVETVQPGAERRGITIRVDAPQTLSFRADRGELSIICNNLMTNAVKYNKEGGGVDVSLSSDEGGLRLVVRDTGIGMSEQDRLKLFGEFVRIRNKKTEGILGSGLGLHIMHKIVALYRGAIRVDSVENEGSTFTVTLPHTKA